jgi:hypothetical protein
MDFEFFVFKDKEKMETPEFPPNSESSKKGKPDPKVVTPVVKSGAVRRRKSLRKQFSETFVGGDFRTAVRYVMFDVLLPAARDTIVEAGAQGIEKLIYGDARRSRGATRPYTGDLGHIAYNRIATQNSRMPGPQRVLSRQARARHNFDEIVLDDRAEAEEVIDRLFDLVSRYESASVADLYELVGLSSSHTDHKWGWSDLHGAGVSRIRGGYLLDLPEPEPLD